MNRLIIGHFAKAVNFCGVFLAGSQSHIFVAAEYFGMSGSAVKNFLEVFYMCNNNCGGNLCWIIVLIILFCGCGNNGL